MAKPGRKMKLRKVRGIAPASFPGGFAPRKRALSIYIMPGFEQCEDLMRRLGKHRTGKSCMYLNKLEDADPEVLETLIRESVARMDATWK